MGARPGKFTEAELRKAIKAAKREGATGVEIKLDGSLRFDLSPSLTGDGDPAAVNRKEPITL